MKPVTIDRFGRVLIPKKLRDQLGLTSGQALDLEVENGKLTLEPSSQESGLARKGNALVFTGKLLEQNSDWAAWSREKSMRQILESDAD